MRPRTVIKSQKRTNEEGNKKTEKKQKQIPNNQQNGNKNIIIKDYLKCKLTTCSNQKTQTG